MGLGHNSDINLSLLIFQFIPKESVKWTINSNWFYEFELISHIILYINKEDIIIINANNLNSISC